MAESYSVEARLSAVDNMSSVFNKVSGSASNFGGRLKSALGSGIAMGVGMKAVTAATNAMSASLDGAISRYDTIQNFPKIMSNLGYSAKDANDAIEDISNRLTGLPTSTDAIVSSAQKLAPIMKNQKTAVSDAANVALALNNALLAGGKSTETQANALEQYSQMLAAGKVDMQAWRSMLDAMPGQLDQLAAATLGAGHNQSDLYEAMKSGKVSFEDFNNALLDLNEDGINGLASFEDQARASTQGIATNIQNVKTAITRGMANSIKSIDDALHNNGLPSIAEMVGIAGDKISDTFNKVNGFISRIDLSKVASVAESAFTTLGNAAETAGKIVGKAITFMADRAEYIASLGTGLLIVAGAFKLLKTGMAIANGIKSMAAAFSFLTPAASASVAPTTAAGNAAKVSAKGFMQAGVGILAMGAGLALAAAGFWVLTQAAIQLATAGAPAVGIMAGMVVAIGGLIALTSVLGAGLTAAAPGIIAFGAAFLMVSVGIAIVTLAATKLAAVLPPVINAVSGAITSFGNTINSVLTTAGAVINSILMTAAVAFMSFGNTINSVLNTVGTLFATFATSVQTVMQSVSNIITATGEAITSVLNAIAGIFDSIGNAALNAGRGFEHVATGIARLTALPLGDLAATLGTTARGLKKIASSGKGMADVASSLALISSSMSKVSSSGGRAISAMNKLRVAMASIAASAAASGTALGSKFAAGIAQGMAKGASVASSSARRIITSLRSTQSAAQATGRQAGSGFSSGLQSGLTRAVSVATSMSSRIVSRVSSAASRLRGIGSNMGSGLAAGLESTASRCERAAARIVAAANKAAAAEAQVHSPSKVWKKIGKYMVEGLRKGLVSKKGASKKTAASVIRQMYKAHNKKISKKKSKSLAEKFLKSLTVQKKDSKKAGKGLKVGVLTKTGKKWVKAGLKTGIVSGFKDVRKTSKSLLSGVNNIMKNATKTHNFTGAADKAISAYSKKLNARGKAAIKSSKAIVNATLNTIKKSLPKSTKETRKQLSKTKKYLSTVSKGLNSKIQKAINKDVNKAIKTADKKLSALAKTYQAKYDSIANARSNFISKMKDFGSLYEVVEGTAASADSYGFKRSDGTTGGIVFKNWAKATKELKTIQSNLQKLKKWGISRSFLDEITNMDVASQLEYTNALIQKGAKFAKQQSDQYGTYMKTASSVGNSVYKSYVDALDKEYKSKLKTVMSNLKKEMNNIGLNAAKGLLNGLKSKKIKAGLNGISKGLANIIVNSVKKSLKIKSPSRVMEGIGIYTGQGLVNGITDMRREVSRAASHLVTIPQIAMAGGYSGSLSSEYEYASQAHYTIEVHTDLDGREIARTIADPMQEELDRKQTRTNRRLGRL